MLTRRVLLSIVFAVVVFVAATIIACDKLSTPELEVDYWIENVDEIVNTYNATVRFEQFSGFNKKGEVDMYKSVDKDGEEIFVILFETPDFEKNKVFGLQSQESIELPDGVPEHLSNAQVVYLGDFLLINDLNSSFKAKFSVKRSSPEIFEQLKFDLYPRIFGLSITTSTKGVSFRNVKAASCKCHAVGVFPLPNCQSGGYGSSQCSQTCGPDDDCSVQCDAGFFACCSCN